MRLEMLSETVGVGQEGKELFKCLWLLEKKRNFLLKRFRTLSSPTINDNASAQKIDSNCNAITDKISPHSIVPQSDNPKTTSLCVISSDSHFPTITCPPKPI